MRDSVWIPRRRDRWEDKRPCLHIPSPWENMPWMPPPDDVMEDDEGKDSPRVIIIDI